MLLPCNVMQAEALFRKLDPAALAPVRAHDTDAGWDLHVLEDTWAYVGEITRIHSGIAIACPVGYYARIVGRSSALLKRNLHVFEGVIDAGFRGELFSCVRNLGGGDVLLERGMSVAQIILTPVPIAVEWHEVPELPDSERGENGWGSSGR